MKGYAEQFFLPEQRELYERAACLMAIFEEEFEPLRCHEVTRVVADVCNVSSAVVDGFFDHIDHSWIELLGPGSRRVILDVYAVGRLPLVQLVDTGTRLLPYAALYKARSFRNDIRHDVMKRLREQARAAGFQGYR